MSSFKRLDWVVITSLFCFAVISLAALYPYSVVYGEQFFLRQLIFYALAFFFMFALSFLNVSYLKKQRGLIVGLYLGGLALLVFVLIAGRTIRGAASWIALLPGNAGLQPSELIKIIIIFILARYFTIKHLYLYKISNVMISGVYAGIPALLTLIQPDLGSALVIFFLWFGMVVLAGMRWSHFLLFLLVVILATGGMWLYVLEPYQQERVLSFLSPESDPLGANYSRNQSLIAIGAGGLFGKGFGNNIHSLDGFLPEAHNDFMFATLAESLGLTGIMLIFALYAIIVYRLMIFQGKDNFDKLFASSLGLLIFIEAAINIGIALGLLPVTGLTLPFLSYGGSSILSLFIGIGIYQALYARS